MQKRTHVTEGVHEREDLTVTDAKTKLQERKQRFYDALALKEPDKVPILDTCTDTFYAKEAGYTMAELNYDYGKTADALRKYFTHYDFDSGSVTPNATEGMGPIFDIVKPKMLLWAGMPDAPGNLDKNSMHQFIEFETVEEDELEELVKNPGEFFVTHYLPRAFGICEPMQFFNLRQNFAPSFLPYVLLSIAGPLSAPPVQNMIDELQKILPLFGALQKQKDALAKEFEEELGLPCLKGTTEDAAFDLYSDFLRGTMGSSDDIMTHPELLDEIMEQFWDWQRKRILERPPAPGTYAFMPLHKGSDMFMSDEAYGRFYYKYLLKLIELYISLDVVPMVFTESSYNTRIKYLKDLPKGKCIVHFEQGDPEHIKRELGDVACLTGLFPWSFMNTATPEQVVDKTKRLLDVMAPGGGYMFSFDGGIDDLCTTANMEALFDTIRTYGVY